MGKASLRHELCRMLTFRRHTADFCLTSSLEFEVNGHWYVQKSWNGVFLEESEVITQLDRPDIKKINTRMGVALTNE